MNILIVGAGWLGLPVAKALHSRGHSICITRRSQSSLDSIDSTNLKGFILDLGLETAEIEVAKIISSQQIDCIVGSFPPAFRQGTGVEYAAMWSDLVQAAVNTTVKKLVMISSTSVYPAVEGNMTEDKSSLRLAEDSKDTFTLNARTILQAEQYVIDSGINYGVLRCSGLIGPDRHPARFVSYMKEVSSTAPANLVHLNDASASVLFTVDNVSNEVLNVTSPDTINKAEFYRTAVDKAGLDVVFPNVIEKPDKTVIANKIIELGFQFQFKSTLDALNAL